MYESTTAPDGAAPETNGHAAAVDRGWPGLTSVDGAERELPRLHTPGARAVVRDRWERLVTVADVHQRPETVWQALTSPDVLARWLAVCHGTVDTVGQEFVLDFEDGEYFLGRVREVVPRSRLAYVWRWLGLGQATAVTWDLEPIEQGVRVTVTEEAKNPPWDWQTWNGGGWVGILDQLSAHLRTGLSWRWPWRRMGPYAQVELPVPMYAAWDQLVNPAALKYWLLAMEGSITPGTTLPILMGDASGIVEMRVREVVQPGQTPPSFLPHVTYGLHRAAWGAEVGGRLWIEPAGLAGSLLQAFHYNWESLPAAAQLSERKLLTAFWADALRRARQAFAAPMSSAAPHNW